MSTLRRTGVPKKRKTTASSGNVQPSQAANLEPSLKACEQASQVSSDAELREGTPTLDDSRLSMPDLDPISVTPEVAGQTVSRSSSTGSSVPSGPVVARPCREKKNQPDAAEEALAMLHRADTEDQWDTMGAAVAARIRELSSERQWAIAPVIYAVLEVFASPQPIADSCDVIKAMKNAAFAVQPSTRTLFPPRSCPDHPEGVSGTPGYPTQYVSHDSGFTDTMTASSPSQTSFMSLMNSPLTQTAQHATSVLNSPPGSSQTGSGEGTFRSYTRLQ